MTGKELLNTAVYGGIGYWSTVIERTPTRVVVEDMEDGTRYTVTAAGMTAAAKDVLRLYPNTQGAQAIREDDVDAEAADMIFQTAALGGVIYG